ncbi:hypothetical protein LOK49_Contig202G00007 [Camellia lanceoleosa]|nr:hypothetical protein LOK49_Contig202G00007 [Camellia lanceoleosa]
MRIGCLFGSRENNQADTIHGAYRRVRGHSPTAFSGTSPRQHHPSPPPRTGLNFHSVSSPSAAETCVIVYTSQSNQEFGFWNHAEASISLVMCSWRVMSKQVAVAGTNSKDIKAALKSQSDIPACLAVGRILAERAREADVYTASYTPRERDKFEGKIRAVVQSLIDNGIDVKVYLD